MKKNILSIRKSIEKANKYCLLIVFTFVSSFIYGQTITPVKTVTNSTTNCGVIDVQLKITGANPSTRDADVVLVIDVSGSMNNTISGDSNKSMYYAKEAAKSFIDAASSNSNNRIAIVSYTTNAKLVRSFLLLSPANIATLKADIQNLTATDATNIQDGIVVASKELNTNGRFNCATARSIVLLTDGVANRTGPTGSTTTCNTTSITSTCVTTAITAANSARTTTKSSIVYNNQIFSIGLFGGISGNINDSATPSQRYVAKYTLDGIQGSAATITYTGSDLTSIYNNIATQIIWVAQSLVEKETIPSGYTISNISVSKGTTSVASQVITWNIDFLNSETITLSYKLAPASTICGNQTTANSTLSYKNSTCNDATLAITTPSVNIPCPTVTLASQENVNCYGVNTGSITLNDATGGTAPYTYDWSDLTGTNDPKNRTNLAAGTYTVTAKDANGCNTAVLSVTITQPSAGLSIAVTSQTNVNCYNDTTGAIDLTISGGTSPYTYTWKKDGNAIAAITQDLSGIGAGTYEVTVTDDKGCKATKSIIIEQPSAGLSIAVTSQTNVNCYNDTTGAIDLTISGGTSPYTYTWKKDGNAIAAITQDLSGIGAGTYEVTVTDDKGCKATKSIVIEQPSAGLSIAVTSQTNVNCYNDTTGAIDLTISGGTSPYTYTWKKDGNAIAAITQDLSGIGAGTYEVTVTDDKGCKATKSIVIDQPNAGLNIAVTSQTNVNCYNDTTGVIDLTISGGTSPYTYTWKKDGNAIAAITQDLSGIGAGTYEVTVTDDKGCKATKSIVIEQPNAGLNIAVASQTNINCYNDTTGAIDLTISGGTSPYTYTWKKDGNAIAAITQDLSGIGAGTYEVTVTDDKGCKATKSIVIEQPSAGLSIAVTSQTNVNCYNDTTGAIDLTISGGTSPYTYTWKKDGNAIAAITQDLSGIGAGTYEVTVTDDKGCKASKSITYYSTKCQFKYCGNFTNQCKLL